MNFELDILRFLENARAPFWNILFEGITLLGEEALLVVIIAAIYYIYDKSFAKRIFYAVIMSLAINSAVKNLVARPRPFERGISCVREHTATGYSFPSGHTQSTATWTSSVFSRLKKSKAVSLSLIITLAVAFSRLYLGAHYLSDVIFGALFGFCSALIFGNLFDKAKSEASLYGISFGVLSVIAIFFAVKGDAQFEDFFKIHGMSAGLLAAVFIEKKHNSEKKFPLWRKLLHTFISIVAALLVKTLLQIETDSVYIMFAFESVKHFILTFLALGVCPVVIERF